MGFMHGLPSVIGDPRPAIYTHLLGLAADGTLWNMGQRSIQPPKYHSWGHLVLLCNAGP